MFKLSLYYSQYTINVLRIVNCKAPDLQPGIKIKMAAKKKETHRGYISHVFVPNLKWCPPLSIFWQISCIFLNN